MTLLIIQPDVYIHYNFPVSTFVHVHGYSYISQLETKMLLHFTQMMKKCMQNTCFLMNIKILRELSCKCFRSCFYVQPRSVYFQFL